MPAAAKLLSVALKDDEPCLWAMVDPEARMVERRIRVVATGEDFSNPFPPFVGTFVLEGVLDHETLVFHVFDGGEHELPKGKA
jgi:hypothetical protein